MDDVLYHIAVDSTLRIVPPVGDREGLIQEAHGGKLAGYLRERKDLWTAQQVLLVARNAEGGYTLFCRSCETCASRNVSRLIKSYLTPTVGGPFNCVGVDVIKFPCSSRGKRYAVVFTDYLIKWPEIFATSDQTSLTIADKLMGIRKSNTTAYHPQTDSLVERFHQTLTDMLAKSVQQGGKDWDQRLPYLLFAYRSSIYTELYWGKSILFTI